MAARIERESDGSDIEVYYTSDSDGNNENLVDLGEEMDHQHYLQSEGVCSDANFLTGLRRDLQASHSLRVSGKNTILPAPF